VIPEEERLKLVAAEQRLVRTNEGRVAAAGKRMRTIEIKVRTICRWKSAMEGLGN
jgi:hypothetical protein